MVVVVVVVVVVVGVVVVVVVVGGGGINLFSSNNDDDILHINKFKIVAVILQNIFTVKINQFLFLYLFLHCLFIYILKKE